MAEHVLFGIVKGPFSKKKWTMDKNQVQNGDSVLLHVRGDRSYITRIAMSKPVDIYHHRVQSDLLIGLIYNAFYMLRGGGLTSLLIGQMTPLFRGTQL